MDKPERRGGLRSGAGRKPNAEPSVTFSVRITQQVANKVREKYGSLSAGLKHLSQQEHPASDADD